MEPEESDRFSPTPPQPAEPSPTPSAAWNGPTRSHSAPQGGPTPSNIEQGPIPVTPALGSAPASSYVPPTGSGVPQQPIPQQFMQGAPMSPVPPSSAPKRRFSLAVVVIVAVCALLVGVGLGFGGSVVAGAVRDRIAARAQSQELSKAYTACGSPTGVTLGDSGKSLNIDGRGDTDSTGASLSDISCILTALNVPDYVVSKMDATRALDGTLNATWDDYEASWNYHPDNGMSLEIHVVDGKDS